MVLKERGNNSSTKPTTPKGTLSLPPRPFVGVATYLVILSFYVNSKFLYSFFYGTFGKEGIYQEDLSTDLRCVKSRESLPEWDDPLFSCVPRVSFLEGRARMGAMNVHCSLVMYVAQFY